MADRFGTIAKHVDVSAHIARVGVSPKDRSFSFLRICAAARACRQQGGPRWTMEIKARSLDEQRRRAGRFCLDGTVHRQRTSDAVQGWPDQGPRQLQLRQHRPGQPRQRGLRHLRLQHARRTDLGDAPFYVVSSALMLFWYLRYELSKRRERSRKL